MKILENFSQNEKLLATAFLGILIIAIIVELYIYFRSKPVEQTQQQATESNDNTIIEETEPYISKVTIHKQGNYELFEIREILTPEECDEIIEIAKAKGMDNSSVLKYGNQDENTQVNTKMDTDHRKSKHTWLNDNDSDAILKMAKYAEFITGLPSENQEMLQVASYEVGGRFEAHFDACVYKDKAYCDKINNNAGQRKVTLLIYLNDDFEGGETEFPKLNLKIKPEKGKGILFHDTDSKEEIYEESIHKGNEVLSGEKWICTKWTHFRKFT